MLYQAPRQPIWLWAQAPASGAITLAQAAWQWGTQPLGLAAAPAPAAAEWQWGSQGPGITVAPSLAQAGWQWNGQAPALVAAPGLSSAEWLWGAEGLGIVITPASAGWVWGAQPLGLAVAPALVPAEWQWGTQPIGQGGQIALATEEWQWGAAPLGITAAPVLSQGEWQWGAQPLGLAAAPALAAVEWQWGVQPIGQGGQIALATDEWQWGAQTPGLLASLPLAAASWSWGAQGLGPDAELTLTAVAWRWGAQPIVVLGGAVALWPAVWQWGARDIALCARTRNPRILIRSAALMALATAAANLADPDFAPLNGCQAALGQTWPSQSPMPGQAAMPNQLLIYGWEEKSESVSGRATAPQFETVMTLVVEARVETKMPAASAALPATANAAAIEAAVDGALDALAFAAKKAVCQGIGAAAAALNCGQPLVMEIRRVDTANKYAESGQRMAGNGAVAFDICYGEHFEPLIATPLEMVTLLINPEAGGAPTPGNTGNGTIGLVMAGLGAEPGNYAVAFTSPGAFTVTMPDGSAAGTGSLNSQFSGGGVSFLIAAGTIPFTFGDGFSVTVAAIQNVITF